KMFEKPNVTISNYEIAKKSTCYLVCAINSVLEGKEEDCSHCEMIKTDHHPSMECQHTSGGNLECVVKDFYLPQETTADHLWDRWIAGLYDPNFLVYYQKFPLGEDQSWTGGSTWAQNVMTVTLYALPTSLIFGAGKRFFVGKVKEIPSKLKTPLSNLLSKIMGKAEKEVEEKTIVVAFGKGMTKKFGELGRKEVSNGLITYYIADEIPALKQSKFFRKELEMALRDEVSGSLVEIRKFTQYAEKEFLNLPDQEKVKILDKIMGSNYLQPTWSDYKRVLKLAGLTGVISAMGAIWDMRNDKFFERPNKIVLQTRTTKNDAEEFSIKKGGYPIILDKKFGFFKKKISSTLVPFYFVSPCRVDVRVTKEDEVPCGTFKHTISTNSIECLARSPKGWWDKFLHGDFAKCDEFPKTSSVYGKFSDRFLEREKIVTDEILSGKNISIFEKNVDVPGSTHKYSLIFEPITGIEFYYNNLTNEIEYIGLKGSPPLNVKKDIGETYKAVDVYLHGVYETLNEKGLGFDIEIDKKIAKKIGLSTDLLGISAIRKNLRILIDLNKSNKELYAINIFPIDIGAGVQISMLQDDGKLRALYHFKYELQSLVGKREILESRVFYEDVKLGTNCIFDKQPVVISAENKDIYVKSPYNEKYNFCFSQPSGTAQGIFIGTMLADLLVQIVAKKPGMRFFSEVGFGLLGGLAVIHLQQNWPGKKYN
ncbi:MAG: hypothetical protein ACTSWW_09060, partial [Promethearchaeota archaeon]